MYKHFLARAIVVEAATYQVTADVVESDISKIKLQQPATVTVDAIDADVTGTVTGVCCESTARDAMMCNFKTIMITDGNAAMTDEDHNASLASFYLTFGDVMPTDTVTEFLRRNAGKGLAAAE